MEKLEEYMTQCTKQSPEKEREGKREISSKNTLKNEYFKCMFFRIFACVIKFNVNFYNFLTLRTYKSISLQYSNAIRFIRSN